MRVADAAPIHLVSGESHIPSIDPDQWAIPNVSDEELDVSGCCIIKERCCPCDVASFDEV